MNLQLLLERLDKLENVGNIKQCGYCKGAIMDRDPRELIKGYQFHRSCAMIINGETTDKYNIKRGKLPWE